MFQVKETALGSLRYTGRSKAVIEDNVDPQKRGRVRVRHPLLGEKSYWIPYLTAPGTFSAPHIGDIVYVECEAGDYNHPVAWGNLPKKGGGAIPDEFLRSEPTNRGMYTPNNHLFEMDDGKTLAQQGNGIRLTTSGGIKFHLTDDKAATGVILSDTTGNNLTLDSLANTWVWGMASGTTVAMDGINDSITAETSFGDKIAISASDGIQMETPSAGGTMASFKSGAIDFTAGAGFSITSAEDTVITSDAAITMTGTAGITATSDDAVTITGNSGITLATGGQGAIEIGAAGVAITGATGELLTIIEELLDALSQATYPGFGAPASNVAQYPAIKAKITGMKA